MRVMLMFLVASTFPVSSDEHFRGFNHCLHSPYRGITATSSTGEIIGPVDRDDWGCIGSRGGHHLSAFSDEEGAGPPNLPPTAVCLREAFPNPAQGETNIRITLPASSSLKLAIYSQDGTRRVRIRLVKTLIDGMFSAGTHQVRWDLTDDSGAPVAPGIYRAILVAGDRALCGDIQVP